VLLAPGAALPAPAEPAVVSLDDPVNCAALSPDGKERALGHGRAPGASPVDVQARKGAWTKEGLAESPVARATCVALSGDGKQRAVGFAFAGGEAARRGHRQGAGGAALRTAAPTR
jgi:hypothetical protein